MYLATLTAPSMSILNSPIGITTSSLLPMHVSLIKVEEEVEGKGVCVWGVEVEEKEGGGEAYR